MQHWCKHQTDVNVRGQKGKKVKEADLYSAFIEVPHTQGAQVRITQCYLQTTPYLPLPRKHLPDGASPDWGCGHLIAAYYSFIYPKGWKAELAWVAGYIMRQFTCSKAVTHPITNRARCRATALIETNALPLHQTANSLVSLSYHIHILLTLSTTVLVSSELEMKLINCLLALCCSDSVGKGVWSFLFAIEKAVKWL